jgi:hypothetical protein
MRPRRVRFTIRGLMIAVLVVAILLSLPYLVRVCLMLSMPMLAIMVLVPAVIAPAGRRIEAVFWAMALHPLVFLVWLSALRFPGHCPPLHINEKNMFLSWPWLWAYSSRFYLPFLGVLGWALAANCSPRRPLMKPLLALPIVWLTTLVVLMWDPFEVQDWFWD